MFRNHAPQCSTGLFQGTGRSIQTSMALPSMPCMPCIAFCLAVPKMLFREHLCARFWHRLGLESCWGSGVSQPCPTVLHKAFPWYWPVHPNIYGFAFYALYALYYLLFSSSEDAISRASLRTLLAHMNLFFVLAAAHDMASDYICIYIYIYVNICVYVCVDFLLITLTPFHSPQKSSGLNLYSQKFSVGTSSSSRYHIYPGPPGKPQIRRPLCLA